MTPIEHLYELLNLAAARSAKDKSNTFVFQTAEALGMTKASNPFGRWMTGYSTKRGDETLWVLHRFYDQSQAFSIQPDRNFIAVRLERNGVEVASEQHEYED